LAKAVLIRFAIPSLERDGNDMLSKQFTHPDYASLVDPLFASQKEGKKKVQNPINKKGCS